MKREDRKNEAYDALKAGNSWRNSRYDFEIEGTVLRVRDSLRGMTLVAYSEARADLADALVEFVEDYA